MMCIQLDQRRHCFYGNFGRTAEKYFEPIWVCLSIKIQKLKLSPTEAVSDIVDERSKFTAELSSRTKNGH